MYRYCRDGSNITLSDSAKVLYEAGYRDIDVNFCKADSEPLELTEDALRYTVSVGNALLGTAG